MQQQAWQMSAAEPPLAPQLAIIDPHHHFWGPGHGGAAFFGRFLPDDFAAEIAKGGHRIEASVYLECGWAYRTGGPEDLRCVGETEYVEAAGAAFAARGGAVGKLVAGIVGRADLLCGDGVAPVLEAHLVASPERFRGIRDILACDPDVHNALNVPAGKSRDPRFRSGFSHLARLGLSFDAWALHPQLGEVTELAREFPNTSIIVNHLGGPIGIGRFAGQRAEAFAQWKTGVTALARCPNVTMKLGGLGMEFTGFGWNDAAVPPDSEALQTVFRPYVLHAIEAFSPSRCMFESNFPVDGVSYGYGTLWNAFKRLVSDFSIDEQNELFHGTAACTYRFSV